MEMSLVIYQIIEAIIFLIPIITLFIKVGGYKQTLEKMKEFPEWKTQAEVRIKLCEDNDKNQSEILSDINKNLIIIQTQVKLLLEDRIKKGDNRNG